ncbi:MAG: glycosyltransferase [archaeon]
MQPKIFLMYLKTGGGHLSLAKALASGIKGKAVPVLVDVIEESPFSKAILEDMHQFSYSNAKWIIEFTYAMHKVPVISEGNSALLHALVKDYLKKRLLKEKPDKIVILHALLIKTVRECLKELKLSIPVTVLIADPFTVHPLWYTAKHAEYLCFTEGVRRIAAKRGIKVTVYPFVFDDAFLKKPTAVQVRSWRDKFGIPVGKKVVLVLGGADGYPGVLPFLQGLLSRDMNAEILMVCGKNKQLLRRVQQLQKKSNYKNLHIFGFVDFIYALMSIAYLVVTKAGPNTLMEILSLGKIPIITTYIWEQEKGNVEFIVKNKFGYYEKNPEKLPLLVQHVLQTQGKDLKRFRPKNGLTAIARHITANY